MTQAADGGRRPRWRRLLPFAPPLTFVAILLPSGWARGTAFALLAVGFVAITLHRHGSSDRRTVLLTAALAALFLSFAVDDVVDLSFGATTFLTLFLFACVAALAARGPGVWTGVSSERRRRYWIWCSALAVLAFTAAAVIVRQAHALEPGDRLGWPAGWALVCSVAILAVALAGGLLVFRPGTRWGLVAGCAFAGGLLPWFLLDPALVVLGETDPDGVVGSCLDRQSCDGFAGIAGFMLVASPFAIGGLFLAAHGAKSVVASRRKRRRLTSDVSRYEAELASAGDGWPATARPLARALLELGRLDEAAVLYERILDSRDPEHWPNAAHNLGWIRHEQGRSDEAAAAYGRASESGSPEVVSSAAFALGFIRFQQGRLDDAAAAYELAIEAEQPGDESAANNLGAVREQQGLPDAAAAAYELAACSDDALTAREGKRRLAALRRRQRKAGV